MFRVPWEITGEYTFPFLSYYDTRTGVHLHKLPEPGLVWTPLEYLDMPVAMGVLELAHGPLVETRTYHNPFLRVVVGMLIKLKIRTPGGGLGLSGNFLPS